MNSKPRIINCCVLKETGEKHIVDSMLDMKSTHVKNIDFVRNSEYIFFKDYYPTKSLNGNINKGRVFW